MAELKKTIAEMVNECDDIELLYLLSSMLLQCLRE